MSEVNQDEKVKEMVERMQMLRDAVGSPTGKSI